MKNAVGLIGLLFVCSAPAATITYNAPVNAAVNSDVTVFDGTPWQEQSGVSGNRFSEGIAGNPGVNATIDSTIFFGDRQYVANTDVNTDEAVNYDSVAVRLNIVGLPPGNPLFLSLRLRDATGPTNATHFNRVNQHDVALAPGINNLNIPLGGFARVQDVPVGTRLRFLFDITSPNAPFDVDRIAFQSIVITATPEPASVLLVGTVFVLAWFRRRLSR